MKSQLLHPFFLTVVILFFGNVVLQFASSHCSYDAPIATCCDTGIRYWAIFYKFAGLSDVGLRGGGGVPVKVPEICLFPGTSFQENFFPSRLTEPDIWKGLWGGFVCDSLKLEWHRENREGLRQKVAPVYLNVTSTRWIFNPPPPRYFSQYGILNVYLAVFYSLFPSFVELCQHLDDNHKLW